MSEQVEIKNPQLIELTQVGMERAETVGGTTGAMVSMAVQNHAIALQRLLDEKDDLIAAQDSLIISLRKEVDDG